MSVLLRPGVSDVILEANFGLVYPAAQEGWQYTCDDIFTGRMPNRTQIADDGRVFVPAADGLYVSDDGCAWNRTGGPLMGQNVYDVSFEAGTKERIWIVGGDPRVVALSTDGGATFVAKHQFPDTLRFNRVIVSRADPKTIYLAGYKSDAPLVLAVSTDGGESWTTNETVSTGVATVKQIVEVAGVDPQDARTIYFSITSPNGDEIWKSTNHGEAPVKTLTLADAEEWPKAGFAFGDTNQTLFVAGINPVGVADKPPASLYVSHDAGKNWMRVPSAATGPRYRCLGYRAGTLYGCGGDQLSGDDFLLGSSKDEGKTWTPIVHLSEVKGAKSCIAARCVPTIDWLCTGYRVCGVRPDAGAPTQLPDAGSSSKPPTVQPHHGCSYGGAGNPAFLVGLLAALALHARRRRP